ncbi:hypothetical protein D5086_030522 [Populus alba]|uniref:Uncharacterized protein n=1 Tax=Populus alba TaxID=43335 RepID=A0ACC4APB9_POPAL
MMYKEIKVYLDDMIAKYKRGEDHIKVLRKLFESDKGIEVDLDKVKAIQSMSSPKIEKEVMGFLGRLNYIAQFIVQLTITCELIFRLLRKKNSRTWNEECEEAFNKINKNLNRNYSIFSSVWDGGSDAFESRNPLIKGVDGFRTIRGRMGQREDPSKWAPNYEGPYVVKKAFSGGALKLSRMDGEDLARVMNSNSVKRSLAMISLCKEPFFSLH